MMNKQQKAHADKMRTFMARPATEKEIASMQAETDADAEHIRETVAEAKRRGITTAALLKERRGAKF